MRWQVQSHSSEETRQIAELLGKQARGGEIVVLASDMGGGKTTFAKGFVRGVGSKEDVTSPTFTIAQVYSDGKFEVHHYDLYRLGELGLMNEEMHETIDRSDCIVLIEWANLAKDLLPAEKLVHVSIERLASDESHRRITIDCPNAVEYLMAAMEGY